MAWKVNRNWRKGRDLNKQKGEGKSAHRGNPESTGGEHGYKARQGQRVGDVEKRYIGITEWMALDFLKNLFSGWILRSLSLKQSARKSRGRCLNRGGTLYDS